MDRSRTRLAEAGIWDWSKGERGARRSGARAHGVNLAVFLL